MWQCLATAWKLSYNNKLPRRAYKPTLTIDVTDYWELMYGRAQPQLVKILILNLNFCFKTYCQTRLGCFYVTALLSWGYGWGWVEAEFDLNLRLRWDLVEV